MASSNSDITVLVTGASGYVASHCVQRLLRDGYRVRGTVRSLRNAVKVQPIRALDTANRGQLELVEADLERPDDWQKVIAGCTYIMHVASPVNFTEESVIKTAVEGTMNVLRAANKCPGVKKIVLTGSCAAVSEGYKEKDRVFNEEDWTNLNNRDVIYYARSKTLAEKAAWDFWRDIKGTQKAVVRERRPSRVQMAQNSS